MTKILLRLLRLINWLKSEISLFLIYHWKEEIYSCSLSCTPPPPQLAFDFVWGSFITTQWEANVATPISFPFCACASLGLVGEHSPTKWLRHATYLPTSKSRIGLIFLYLRRKGPPPSPYMCRQLEHRSILPWHGPLMACKYLAQNRTLLGTSPLFDPQLWQCSSRGWTRFQPFLGLWIDFLPPNLWRMRVSPQTLTTSWLEPNCLNTCWWLYNAKLSTTLACKIGEWGLLIRISKHLLREHPFRSVCIRAEFGLIIKCFEKGLTSQWLSILSTPCSRVIGACCLSCCWFICPSHLIYEYDGELYGFRGYHRKPLRINNWRRRAWMRHHLVSSHHLGDVMHSSNQP